MLTQGSFANEVVIAVALREDKGCRSPTIWSRHGSLLRVARDRRVQRPINKRLSHDREYDIQLLLLGADPFKQTHLAESNPERVQTFHY